MKRKEFSAELVRMPRIVCGQFLQVEGVYAGRVSGGNWQIVDKGENRSCNAWHLSTSRRAQPSQTSNEVLTQELKIGNESGCLSLSTCSSMKLSKLAAACSDLDETKTPLILALYSNASAFQKIPRVYWICPPAPPSTISYRAEASASAPSDPTPHPRYARPVNMKRVHAGETEEK